MNNYIFTPAEAIRITGCEGCNFNCSNCSFSHFHVIGDRRNYVFEKKHNFEDCINKNDKMPF